MYALKIKWPALMLSLVVIIISLASVIGLGTNVIFSVASETEDTVRLPIIMYHSIQKNNKAKSKFIITPEEFEGDLKYIKDNGYTTIVMQDLIDFVYENKELPEKPIMLTFDDGYYNNYLYAFPLVKQYECKIILSPIGKQSDI